MRRAGCFDKSWSVPYLLPIYSIWVTGAIRSQPSIEETGAVSYCEGDMEKFNTGGLRRHEIIYSLDTGRLMGDSFCPALNL